jgi:leader peptidase (prepilin peptidase)/N-methyltransferase
MIETVMSENGFLYAYFSLIVFWLGACMGSFLNVCIYRIPLEQSVVYPPSHCPSCKTPIPWYQNIPLVAWIALKARCASCGTRISARYITVEALVAFLFLLAWFKLGADPRPLGLVAVSQIALIPIFWLIIYGLVLGTFVDFDHMILPDRVTLGGIVLGVLISWFVPDLHRLPGEGAITAVDALKRAAIGAAAGSGSLYAIAIIGRLIYKQDAMGLGDVKLMGAIGAFFGWGSVIFSVMISALVGSVVGVSLVLLRGKSMQSRIPYGPYIALAALIWMNWGSVWWYAYMAWITPARLF